MPSLLNSFESHCKHSVQERHGQGFPSPFLMEPSGCLFITSIVFKTAHTNTLADHLQLYFQDNGRGVQPVGKHLEGSGDGLVGK